LLPFFLWSSHTYVISLFLYPKLEVLFLGLWDPLLLNVGSFLGCRFLQKVEVLQLIKDLPYFVIQYLSSFDLLFIEINLLICFPALHHLFNFNAHINFFDAILENFSLIVNNLRGAAVNSPSKESFLDQPLTEQDQCLLLDVLLLNSHQHVLIQFLEYFNVCFISVELICKHKLDCVFLFGLHLPL